MADKTPNISSKNFFVEMAWPKLRYGLEGSALAVYCIIYGFSQDGKSGFEEGIEYLMWWTGASRVTIRKILQDLTDRNLITAEHRAGKPTVYRWNGHQDVVPGNILTRSEYEGDAENALQQRESDIPSNELTRLKTNTQYDFNQVPGKNLTPSNELTRLKTNTQYDFNQVSPANNTISEYNILREGGEGSVGERPHEPEPAHAPEPTFEDWWNLYGMQEWASEKGECLRCWVEMTPLDRMRVMVHTAAFAPVNLQRKKRKHPRWYFKDELWRNDISTIEPAAAGGPTFYDGSDLEFAISQGIRMVQVRYEGRYKITTADDAKKYGLEVTKNWN